MEAADPDIAKPVAVEKAKTIREMVLDGLRIEPQKRCVRIPESFSPKDWGVTLYCRVLGGGTGEGSLHQWTQRLRGSVKLPEDQQGLLQPYSTTWMVIETVCDEHGNRIFSEMDHAELCSNAVIGKLVEDLARVAYHINHIMEDPFVVQELAKNSDTTTDSTSAVD